jgi:hypothetical protein
MENFHVKNVKLCPFFSGLMTLRTVWSAPAVQSIGGRQRACGSGGLSAREESISLFESCI